MHHKIWPEKSSLPQLAMRGNLVLFGLQSNGNCPASSPRSQLILHTAGNAA